MSVESDSLMSAEKRHLSVWDQTAGLKSAYTERRMIRFIKRSDGYEVVSPFRTSYSGKSLM